jgi:hypothetical protein
MEPNTSNRVVSADRGHPRAFAIEGGIQVVIEPESTKPSAG